MERFYDDDPEDKDKEPFFGSNDDDEDDDDDDDDDGDEITIMDSHEIIDVMSLDLARAGLNQKLLNKAIKIAKQSWWWCFKSSSTKLEEIEKIYKRLLKLTDKEEEEEEDEEDEE
jgi:hypothetical protein